MNRDDSNITVLIAEDEVTNYIYIREVLRGFNLNILHAENGFEAVEMFKENKDTIALVLMDVKMPIMDGYQATLEIREISSTIPIVAITAYALVEEETRAMNAGCNQYVSKPVSKHTLRDIILSYLNVEIKSKLL